MLPWVLGVSVFAWTVAGCGYWYKITRERERLREGPFCPYCRGVHPPLDEVKGEPEVVSLRRSRCHLRARIEELEEEVRSLRSSLAAAQRSGRPAGRSVDQP